MNFTLSRATTDTLYHGHYRYTPLLYLRVVPQISDVTHLAVCFDNYFIKFISLSFDPALVRI